ncbi:MAG: DUF5711 family protein [Tissierellia bacterium]|nr:DUF5711 family protein [Tissierellia bacterium]
MDKKWIKYGAIAVLIIVILLSLFLAFHQNYDGFQKINLQEPKSLVLTDKVAAVKDKDRVLTIDDRGKTRVIYEGRMKDLAAGDEYFYILNDGIDIYKENGKHRKTIEDTGDYQMIKGENNTLTVLGDHEIKTLDNDGNLLAKQVDEEAMFTLSAVNKKRNYFAYAALDTDENRYISEFYLHGSKGLILHHEFVDQVIYAMKFMDDDLVMLTNRSIYVFTSEHELYSVYVDDIKSFDVNGEGIYIIDGDSFIVYDEKLNRIDKINLRSEYEYILSHDRDVILYNERGYGVYRTNQINDYKVDGKIKKVVSNRHGVYLVFNNRMERIP